MGMLIANVPVVLLGGRFAQRLPLKALHYGAAPLFIALGIWFAAHAAAYWPAGGQRSSP